MGTAQKTKFSFKDFFSKCDRSFIFYAVGIVVVSCLLDDNLKEIPFYSLSIDKSCNSVLKKSLVDL